jgi:hypothetical protein
VAEDRVKALEDFICEYTGETLEEIGQGLYDALDTAAELIKSEAEHQITKEKQQ